MNKLNQTFCVEIPKKYTAVIHKEGKWYVADCPELGTVSQGKTVSSAVDNLKDATELYLKTVSENKFSRYYSF